MANQRSSAKRVMCRKTTKSLNYFPEGAALFGFQFIGPLAINFLVMKF